MAIKDVVTAMDNYGWNNNPITRELLHFKWMEAVTKELVNINNVIIIDDAPGLSDIKLFEAENA